MNKKLVSLLAFVFIALQVVSPVSAVAQSKDAKVAVVEDLSSLDDESGYSKSREESSIYKQVEANSPLDRKVTIRVNNVPIGTFLNSISAQSKINFIMGQEFSEKKVSASLTNVTVREALDTLLRVQGLTYQRIGKSDSYVITKRSEEAPDAVTKVYTLNYVSLQGQSSVAQDMKSIMPSDVTSSAIGGGSTTNNIFDVGGSGAMGGGGGGSMMGGSSSGGGEGSSAILTIIKSVLTKNGKIAIDARTNKLIITDVPEVFPQVESILAELDVKAPQILIEAQIVEVSKGSGYDIGFKWNTQATLTGGGTELPWNYWAGNNTPNASAPTGLLKWLMGPSKWDEETVTNPDGSETTTYNLNVEGTSPKIDFSTFNVMFQAMMSNGEARSLGKPKVITVNNNSAIITSSREAAVSTVTQQNGTGDGYQSTSGVERRRIGLTLTVTPQVNKEGYVTLTVQPSYTDLVASEGSASGNFDPVTRAISTQVRVKSGQTVVLGGLLQSTEKETVSKVPLLGQIPIIGWFFTHKSKTKSTTDLVIFITPTVLSE